MKKFVTVSAIFCLASTAYAQQAPPTSAPSAPPTQEARLKALEDQIGTLAKEVAVLRGELKAVRDAKSAEPASDSRVLLTAAHVEPGMLPANPAPIAASTSPDPVPASAQVAQTQAFGGATSNAKLLNPDISLIGDFIGTGGRNIVSPSRSLELHESEVGIQAIIDPYARADAFLSFGETGVNVEEAYVTFTSLPAGLLMKVGKMRADFGKVNTIHNHALAYIDRPLATDNLVGGEDGIDDSGISITRFLPAPKNWFAEGTAQVFRGDSSTVYAANRREDLSVVGHLRAYRFSRLSMLSACTPPPNIASIAAGPSVAASTAAAAPPMRISPIPAFPVSLRIGPASSARFVDSTALGISPSALLASFRTPMSSCSSFCS